MCFFLCFFKIFSIQCWMYLVSRYFYYDCDECVVANVKWDKEVFWIWVKQMRGGHLYVKKISIFLAISIFFCFLLWYSISIKFLYLFLLFLRLRRRCVFKSLCILNNLLNVFVVIFVFVFINVTVVDVLKLWKVLCVLIFPSNLLNNIFLNIIK